MARDRTPAPRAGLERGSRSGTTLARCTKRVTGAAPWRANRTRVRATPAGRPRCRAGGPARRTPRSIEGDRRGRTCTWLTPRSAWARRCAATCSGEPVVVQRPVSQPGSPTYTGMAMAPRSRSPVPRSPRWAAIRSSSSPIWSSGVPCEIQPSPTSATRRRAGAPEPPIQIGTWSWTGRDRRAAVRMAKPPLERRGRLIEQGAQRRQGVVQDRASLVEGDAERVELGLDVPGTDADDHAATRQPVEGDEGLAACSGGAARARRRGSAAGRESWPGRPRPAWSTARTRSAASRRRGCPVRRGDRTRRRRGSRPRRRRRRRPRSPRDRRRPPRPRRTGATGPDGQLQAECRGALGDDPHGGCSSVGVGGGVRQAAVRSAAAATDGAPMAERDLAGASAAAVTSMPGARRAGPARPSSRPGGPRRAP